MKTKFWLIQVNTTSDKRYNKITNLAHNFGEVEAKSGGNSVKLILKYSSFFFNFVANFWDKRGNLVIRKV